MLNKEDYTDDQCPLIDLNGNKCDSSAKIPVSSIIFRLDEAYSKEDYVEATRLLKYWIDEANLIGDERGKLSMLSEVMGLSRRINDEKWGLESINEAIEIIERENLGDNVSTATIYLNGATTLKAFGKADKAVPYYEKAEKIYLLNLSDGDARFGGLYNNYALALADLSEYEKAQECFEKALAVLGGNAPCDEAITYVNLAELSCKAGKDEKTIDGYLEKGYLRLTCDKVERDGYFAFVCRKCAPAYGYYGFFKRQIELDKFADEIYQKNGKN